MKRSRLSGLLANFAASNQSHKSKRLPGRRPSASRLRIDALECRNLMAGWVANGVILNGGDPGMDVVVDAAGNSYVSGYFSGTVQFGNTILSSSGNQDAFVTKVDSAGNFVWAVSAG